VPVLVVAPRYHERVVVVRSHRNNRNRRYHH
jgi:hypothetical protein